MHRIEYKVFHTNTQSYCYLEWSMFLSPSAGMLFCGKFSHPCQTRKEELHLVLTVLLHFQYRWDKVWNLRCCNELKCLPSLQCNYAIVTNMWAETAIGSLRFVETICVSVFNFKVFRVWVLIEWRQHNLCVCIGLQSV